MSEHGDSIRYSENNEPPLSDFVRKIGFVIVCCLITFSSSLNNVIIDNSLKREHSLQEILDELPFQWTPEYWTTLGAILGCVTAIILLKILPRQRILEWFCIPNVIVCSVIFNSIPWIDLDATSIPKLVLSLGLSVSLILQGISESLTTISVSIVALEQFNTLETNKVASLIIGLTKLPALLSEFLYSADKFRQLVRLMSFACALNYALIRRLSIFQDADFPAEGEPEEDLTSSVLSDHSLQTTQVVRKLLLNKLTCMRPFLLCSGILVLPQLMGGDIFEFYTLWAFRYGSYHVEPKLVLSFTSLASGLACAVLLGCCRQIKLLSWLLVLFTLVVLGCLFTAGLLLHELEQGLTVISWLPVTTFLTYSIASSLGPGSLSIPVTCILTPATLRTIVIPMAQLAYCIIRHLNVRYLLSLINILHPFGVFWLHACLTGCGLVYLSFIVTPELHYLAQLLRCQSPTQPPTSNGDISTDFTSLTLEIE